ncbi:M23 family metallopeptidase [Vibrio sp. SS-MA-C1-2]|uniref:M23 family metallopeptidase n=1 Tax=Vibrio sp. SS-MA-C1-2 TaxID=2908646 RepID=UPI001F3C8CD3|nr:M23 family metallopeptidase [Vibrio sp. SS-MA-C1-2]UJF19722.1 M23 family metallopeptidase [Vibrio sp. SS-MA-C1-2]
MYRISISSTKGSKGAVISTKQIKLVVGAICTLFVGVIGFSSYSYMNNQDLQSRYKKLVNNYDHLENNYLRTVDELSESQSTYQQLANTYADEQAVIEKLAERIGDVEGVLDFENANIAENLTIDESGNNFDNLDERISYLESSATLNEMFLSLIPSARALPKGSVVTSGYGKREHPVLGEEKFHKGLDYRCKVGDEVKAVADGVVTTVNYQRGGYGRTVKLGHSFGFTSVYAHLNKALVKRGQFIKKGDVIAQCGNTGRSTASHLHLEFRWNNRAIDPVPYILVEDKGVKSVLDSKLAFDWNGMLNSLTDYTELNGFLVKNATEFDTVTK